MTDEHELAREWRLRIEELERELGNSSQSQLRNSICDRMAAELNAQKAEIERLLDEMSKYLQAAYRVLDGDPKMKKAAMIMIVVLGDPKYDFMRSRLPPKGKIDGPSS